jgi:hypothetical protein
MILIMKSMQVKAWREGETKKEAEGPGRPKFQKRDERKLPRK